MQTGWVDLDRLRLHPQLNQMGRELKGRIIMTKEEFGKTVFVSVRNTWGRKIKSKITGERVSLADCAMGYWIVANSPKIEQCE